jgi:hypothetical protein
MDENATTPRQFQFTLLTLLICVSSFGVALGSFHLAAQYVSAYPVLGMLFHLAAGAFWGGGIGALFGRFWRCAIIGAVTWMLFLAILRSSVGYEILNFLTKLI